MRLRAVAVVGKQVGATAKVASDAARDAQRLDAVHHGRRGGQALESLKVNCETNKVRASHRGTAKGRSGRVATNVRGQDTNTGAEDVNTGT
jgi:hypothetical protein